MNETCPHCLGLKRFCFINRRLNASYFLFSVPNYEIGSGSHELCDWYNTDIFKAICRIGNNSFCRGLCPLCNGTGKSNWIEELYVGDAKPNREDFRKLKEYLSKK